MNRPHSSVRKPQRTGFTLIELLVVISIIATLAALILPAIGSARSSARRAQCLNNMRNISLAVQNFASSHDGRVPYLTSSSKTLNYSTASMPSTTEMPWTVTLLPLLDQAALFDRLLGSNEDSPSPNKTSDLAQTSLAVFNCPDDSEADAPGNNSYVANGGYITWPFWGNDNDLPIGSPVPGIGHQVGRYFWAWSLTVGAAAHEQTTFSTGVFWREANSDFMGAARPTKKMTLDFISRGDGQSNTLMLSENLNARAYVGPGVGGWASQVTSDLAFLLPVKENSTSTFFFNLVSNEAAGMGLTIDGKKSGLAMHGNGNDFEFDSDTRVARINANVNSALDGASPRPSSNHPGQVNVMFCDGHGKALSQNISDIVYAVLVSPNGGEYGQDIIGSNDF